MYRASIFKAILIGMPIHLRCRARGEGTRDDATSPDELRAIPGLDFVTL
jgi:hypothetical protein